MKRTLLHIILLLLLAAPMTAQTRLWSSRTTYATKFERRPSSQGLLTSQYDGVHHLVGMYADGAYSFFLNNVPSYHTNPGGYSVGFGFLYAYQHGPMLVQVGLGARWQDITDSVAPQHWTRGDYDSNGVPFTLHYSFTNRLDRTRNIYFSLPVSMGGYFGPFYALGGIKLNLQVWGDSHMKSTGSTYADYIDGAGNNIFIGPIYQMDNHGLRKDVDIANDGKRVNLSADILATAEIGYEIPLSNKGRPSYRKNREQDMRIRIGLFAEIGVLNICPKKDNSLFDIPESTRYDFPTFTMNHMFSSSAASGYSIHSFFAGLRVSYFFFGYQSKEKCLLCGSRGFQSPWK